MAKVKTIIPKMINTTAITIAIPKNKAAIPKNKAIGPQRGRVTNHQDQLITLVNLRIKKIRNRTQQEHGTFNFIFLSSTVFRLLRPTLH